MIKTIYQNDEYLTIESLRTPGKPKVFSYHNNKEKASYFFYKQYAGNINGKDYWNIIVPTRGNCGFVFDNENPSLEFILNFLNEFDAYAFKTNIVCEYTKFDWWNPVPKPIFNRYKTRLHSYNYTVNLTDDFFMKEFSQSRRNEIRKIIKCGYSVEFVGMDYINTFMNLYEYTQEKFNIKKEYQCTKEYFKKCFLLFPNNCQIEIVKKNGTIIAATLLMYTEDMLHATFRGVDSQCENNPTPLMDYEACLFGKKHGCKYYDMGNALINSGLEKYKKSFVKESGGIASYVGNRIIDKKVYQKLIEVNGRNIEGYFPEFKNPTNKL